MTQYNFSIIASALALGMVACASAQPAPKLPAGGQVIVEQSQLILANGEQYGTIRTVPAEGTKYPQALRIETARPVANTWDYQVGVVLNREVKVGEVMLVSFALRAVKGQPETGEAQLMVDFTTTGPDYSKSITQVVNGTRNWRVVHIPFQVLHARLAGQSMLNLRVGYPPQVLDVADFKLTVFPAGVKLSDLPRTRATYAGDAADAPWRRAAAQRIEDIRKGDLGVVVKDAAGKPVSGARIEVRQRTHDFHFGTAVDAGILTAETPEAERYRTVFKENFNQVVIENHLKWPFYESTGRNDALRAVKWLNEQGFPVRGHNVVWPSWGNSPKDLEGLKNDPTALRRRVDERIKDVIGATKGQIYEWDVINEPYSNHDIMDVLGADEMARWFRLVKELDPKPRLTLNDYPPLDGAATSNPHLNDFYKTIARLQELKAPIEAIGFQCHFGSEMIAPERVLSGLDRFAKFGLPIVITEFDMESQDRDLQARYMKDFLTVVFSHPSVTGVTQWGFWEGRHWMPNAALWTRDWQIKPHGQVYIDQVNKIWRTNANGRSGSTGQYSTRAFFGTYAIKAILPDGRTKDVTVTHTRSKRGEVIIQF